MEDYIPLEDLKPVIQPKPITTPVIIPVTIIDPPLVQTPVILPVVKSSFWPTTPENWTLWITSFSLTILFLVGAYVGARSSFFVNLPVKANEPTWLIAGLWILASLISYASFYLVRDYDDCIYGQSRLLPLFLIISYLNIAWLVTFYVYGNFILTLIILGTVILVNFYILVFLYYINVWAAVSVLPLFVMYLYLFYSILHLASINQVVL